jgi:uncharacterized protein (DUF1330 family)
VRSQLAAAVSLSAVASWLSLRATGDRPALVMLEFEDLEAARRWYESEAYQEAKKLREGAASFRAIAVQGID